MQLSILPKDTATHDHVRILCVQTIRRVSEHKIVHDRAGTCLGDDNAIPVEWVGQLGARRIVIGIILRRKYDGMFGRSVDQFRRFLGSDPEKSQNINKLQAC